MADAVQKTVLSSFSAQDFGRAQMLVQVQKFFNAKATQKTEEIGHAYTAKINSINAESSRWESVQDDLSVARSQISDSLGRARAILNSLDTMIRTVNQCGQNTEGYVSPQSYAAAFDSYLRSLDTMATQSSPGSPNLLGVAKQEIDFPLGLSGARQTVASAYIGSDYYIVDTESKYWDLDRSAKILKRYDVYPDDPTSTAGNIATGLRLDDLTGDSITFTVAPNTASPQTFTGTLYRKGLNLLDSWAYEGLSTEEGRNKALADLNAAKIAIDLEVRRYQLANTTIGYYEDIAAESIKGLDKKTDQLRIEQAIAIQEEQTALTQEYQASSSVIVQALAIQNQYGKMLAPLFSNKFSKSLVSILA